MFSTFPKRIFNFQITVILAAASALNSDLCKICRLVLRLHPLPNHNALNLFKFKAFVDNNLDVAKMAEFVCDRVENTVGKGEDAGK